MKKMTGFTLIEVMIGIGLASLVSLGGLYLMISSTKSVRRGSESYWTTEIRNEIFAAIKNDLAWAQSVAQADNLNLACLRTRTSCMTTLGNIDIYDAGGKLLAASLNPAAGFSSNGTICYGFDPVNGNNSCPFRTQIYWAPICESTSTCLNPEPFIHVSFIYRPKVGEGTQNLQTWGFDIIRPVQAATLSEVCQSMGGILDTTTQQCAAGSLNLLQCGTNRVPAGIAGSQVLCQPVLSQTCPVGQISNGFYSNGLISCVSATCLGGKMPAVPTDCQGQWSTCSGGLKTFTVVIRGANGGKACPVAEGASIACTKDVDCQGQWGTCVGGLQKYDISVPLSGAGAVCSNTAGATQVCTAPTPVPQDDLGCLWTAVTVNPPSASCTQVTANTGKAQIACTHTNVGTTLDCYSFHLTCGCVPNGVTIPAATPTPPPICTTVVSTTGGGFLTMGAAGDAAKNALVTSHSSDLDYTDLNTCFNQLVSTQNNMGNKSDAAKAGIDPSNFTSTSNFVKCSCLTDTSGPGTWMGGNPGNCVNCYFSQYTSCLIQRCN
jgi:hypothetical protein